MAIQTLQKNIQGSNYTCTQLPARRALKLKAKLIKIFGPMLAQFFTSDKKQNNDNLVRCIEMLSQHLDENIFDLLVVEILQGVRKDGVELQPAIIDLEFAGDFGTLYQVLWFALETNFASFFQLVGIGNQSQENQSQDLVTKKTFMKTSQAN